MPGVNKNYMSIGVSVRTTKFAARSNSRGIRQKNRPQSATFHTVNFRRKLAARKSPLDLYGLNMYICTYLLF